MRTQNLSMHYFCIEWSNFLLFFGCYNSNCKIECFTQMLIIHMNRKQQEQNILIYIYIYFFFLSEQGKLKVFSDRGTFKGFIFFTFSNLNLIKKGVQGVVRFYFILLLLLLLLFILLSKNSSPKENVNGVSVFMIQMHLKQRFKGQGFGTLI